MDEVNGKLQAVGARRASIVATAGFTGPAIEKIRSQRHRLDGFELRKPIESDWAQKWDVQHVDLMFESQRFRTPLEALTVVDALTDESEMIVLRAVADLPDFEGGFFIVGPTRNRIVAGEDVNYETYTMRTHGAERIGNERVTVSVTYTNDDGTVGQQTVPPQPVRNLKPKRRRNRY